MNKKEIIKVIRIVEKETRKSKNPIVTQVSEQTRSPYQVLISCLLSLRTRDKTTEKASKRLFAMANTPYKMVKLSTGQIEKAIYPVGFYKVKSRRIKNISNVLIKKYNGKIPSDFSELMKFKGIGRKTANIVLVYGYNKPALPIDTHCHRIPNRLGWIKTKTPEKTEDELRKLIPKKYWLDFNNNFVIFGQNICKPLHPLCELCPVNKYCNYYKQKNPD